ncbi:uncharacterized protein LOC104898309 isoform X4 [Beta vulgaris subsp. vulgaris]|uniref:uncharacterized protein LOC104898309 isoform X4 n=1 Tax=Beta vulgaris subsp. vulgaris TaxID=3555 RepID=UPI002546F1D9|nr:uncharacterized protein LOC104898309 isoform X4 [Beta vulgaris subsp. vulgaris]
MEVMVLMQIYWMKKVDESTFFPSLFSSSIRFGGRRCQPKNSGSCEEHCDCSYCCCTAGVLYGCFRIGRIFPQLVVASQVAS